MIPVRLDIADGSGTLQAGDLAALRRNIAGAIAETRRYRVLGEGEAGERSVFVLTVGRGEDPTFGKPCWELALCLRDAATGRELGRHGCRLVNDRLDPSDPMLRDLAYYFAAKDDYPDLARRAGMAGRVEHPDLMMRNPQVLLSMIMADLANGAWEKAVEHATTLLEVRPDMAGARHFLALALLRLNRLDEALREAAARTEAEAPHAVDWILRGDVESARGDHAAARLSFESALRLEPTEKDAAARLTALDFLLDAGDRLVLLPRIGWRLGFIRFLGLGADGPGFPERRAKICQAALAVDEDLAAVFGERLEHFADEEACAAWLAMIKAGGGAEFSGRTEQVCSSAARKAGQHLPPDARDWLTAGYGLLWAQAAIVSTLCELEGGRPADPARAAKLFRTYAALAAPDSELARRHPAVGAAIKGFPAALAAPPDAGGLKAADEAIEAFRRALFGEA